eukprot:COSAG01_NODE_1304_length_10809_cov_2.635387_2_plen_96_part_00
MASDVAEHHVPGGTLRARSPGTSSAKNLHSYFRQEGSTGASLVEPSLMLQTRRFDRRIDRRRAGFSLTILILVQICSLRADWACITSRLITADSD